MLRVLIAVTLTICLICAGGCGGGGGSGGQTTTQVQIQSDRVVPKNATIQAGNLLRWLNIDTLPHQVVSGTLDPQGNPNVVHQITIGNTGFTPLSSEINLGDMVRFSNVSSFAFTFNIVDDNGTVVSQLNIPQGGQQNFQFQAAGKYSLTNVPALTASAIVFVFGSPHPDGLFQSVNLINGGTFTLKFPTAGSFAYFIQDQSNPDRSFITGTVTAQ